MKSWGFGFINVMFINETSRHTSDSCYWITPSSVFVSTFVSIISAETSVIKNDRTNHWKRDVLCYSRAKEEHVVFRRFGHFAVLIEFYWVFLKNLLVKVVFVRRDRLEYHWLNILKERQAKQFDARFAISRFINEMFFISKVLKKSKEGKIWNDHE